MSQFPPIAIIGHGCVLPGALGPAELWRAVVEGRDLLRPVPPGVWRVDTAKALSPQAPERSATDRGGYVQGFDAIFDPNGFACPAAELAGLDPLVLWLVHSGREALREAGLDVAPRGRCGLIAGNLSYPTASLSAYAEAVWLDREGPKPANRFSSGLPAQLAARALGLQGAAFCLDAACASSLYAVKLACDQLHDGHADLMVAAGVNRGDDLFLHMGFTALNALSPTGRSRPFHREADGLIPAEGAACVVLKRLDDAVRDGNRILGVIRGIGLSNDGRSRGFLVPDAGGQERAMAAAYAQAGFGPEAVSLVECHATGTALGDATEIASMGRVFAGLRDVPIGSLKSNLGHLIAAAGLAGMVKVIQAMAAGIRPPTLHADAAPLDGIGASPFRLLDRAEPWDAEGPRRAGISAFGFGGNNAHLVLEEWHPATVSVPVVVPPPPLRVAVVGLAVATAADDFAAALAAPPSGNAPCALDSITLDLAATRVPPADLLHALPQQLLAMKAVARAVADAPALPAATTGVLMGMGCDAEVARRGLGVRLADLCGPDASVDLGPPLNAAGVIGTMPNIVANRFNAQFDWRGPSYSVSAEELSGLAGLRIAARALVTGELDAAVVGAVDLSCEPVHRSALAALRPDLDTPGDAAVVLVLRRVECAEAAGEPIHAILDLSSAADSSATEAEFTIAGPQGASPVTRRFGHAHAASGLLHVAAAVVACRGRMKPGDGAAQPWLDAGRLRARVSVEALGGAADGLLVESGSIAEPAVPPPVTRLRWFAAADRAELCARIRRGEDGGQGPVRLAFACPAGKEADTLSRALTVAEGREAAPDGIHFGERPLGGGLALVFTGAAAAYEGMGRELFLSMPDVGRSVTARFPILAHAADRLYGSAEALDAMVQLQTCALICQTHAEVSRAVLGLRPAAVMGLSSGETNALFAAGVWSDMGAMFAEIDASGIYGRHLTGDCLAAAQSWGQAGAADWRNWRLLAPIGEVEAALAGLPRVSITIVNAPQDCVIGGDADSCRQAIARIGAHRALPLGQDMVVHCAEMAPCAPVWRRIHSRETTPPERIAVYANAFGQAYRPSVELCAEALTRQALERVDFPRTIRRAHDDGLRIFVEHGPRNALTRSIAATLAGREHLAVSLDHPGRAPLEQLAHVAAALFAAGQEPAMAEVARRLERRTAAPPAQPLTFAAHAAPVAVVLGQPMPPAPPLPPVADLPPPDLAARRPLDEAPEPEPEPILAVPTADSPIARILARTAELHTGYLKTASDLHRTYLQGFGVPTLSTLPLPPGERIGVRGMHGVDSRVTNTAEPPHPNPLPGGERGLSLPDRPLWDRAQLEILASGKVSDIFGPLFAQQDGYARQVRMPEPPLLLVDRVISITGEPGGMGLGSIVTETDVTPDSWYLHNDRMPVGLAIESGQADLLLVSWLGADFRNRGERVYRLLGCEMTYHEGGLPRVGDTLRYDIHIDGHARMGEVGLFFFHYDCRIGDRLVLSVRNGQAGFFTDHELANSGGVLWSAEEDRPKDGARLDPLPCPSRHRAFTAEQLDLWTAGRAFACFGEGFELAGSHQRTPAIPQGRMRLIDSVSAFEPQGGPWGRGYLRAESHVPADAWFYAGHFKNDPCMPGTLMAEGAVQAVATFMAAGGFTIGRDSWRFEPVPDEPARFVCRGQVIPDDAHHLVYEVFVEEIEDGPTPIVRAALLCSADGFKVFHCRAFAVRMVPDWPLGHGGHALPALLEAPRIVGTRGDVRGDYEALLACAWGAPSLAFGSMYARFDAGRVPRLPGLPYHFMTSVVSVNCPAGEPTVGGTLLVDYAVEPEAWYFARNAAPVMPFCVLMEVLLQPCGWLASYMGFALASTEDLAIRNLDGDAARVMAEVTPTDTRIRTEATLSRFSRAGGITLISFKVRAWVDDRPLMELETSFGFFASAALAKQNGLPPLPDDDARGIPPATSVVEPRRTRLADGMLSMVDEVTGWWPQGGAGGLGLIRGRQVVDPESWYFKAHFFQDPVQPGSLGVEALLQLLERAMILAGLDSELPAPRFEGAALDQTLRWKYRGQVVPTNRTVTTEIEIVRIERDERGILAVARGSLWADDLRIYEVDGLAARLVPGDGGNGGIRLDLDSAPWLGDHRPTHSAAAVPLTCLADIMAAAAHGKCIAALEDVRVQRWATVPVTLVPEVEPDGRVTLRDGGSILATGRVVRADAWLAPPQPFAPLEDARPSPCPYAAAELFHGPAFQILSGLRTGSGGASADLDAAKAARVPGPIGPALLDAGLHATPRHAPELWWGDRAAGMLAYPSAIERLSFFGPPPRDGTVRIEVRALPLDPQGRARSRLQWIADGRVWAEMELADVLFPKGALGKAPAPARQAFLRDRKAAPGVRLSRAENGASRLSAREVAASNWLPGTLESLYGVSGNPSDMARAIAAKEHAAAQLGVHPGVVTVEGDVARCTGAPLNPVPLSVTRDGTDWVVTGTVPAAPDVAPLKAFWRSHLGTADWPVEDLFLALAGEFVGQVRVAEPDELARIRDRGALFLGNHQVAVESLTFTLVAAALTGRPILTVAKAEHRNTWLGSLLALSGSAPGLRLPQMMMLFDREDPAAMLGLMEQAREAVKHHGMSIMVHAEGTRSLSCRTPVSRLSGVFLDLAARLEIPIVPVRFAGALPVESAPERLDFPLGFARQDIHIGAPLWPEDLASLPLAERKRAVLDAINGTGAVLSDEVPNEPRPDFEEAARAIASTQGLGLPRAATLQAVLNAIPSDRPLAGLARRMAMGEGAEDADPWLSALAGWLRTQ